MADLQLNKPLYKSTGPDGAAGPGPGLPRPPRASMMPRMGAILVDILLLHFLFLAIIKLAPGPMIRLGAAGEWVGLAVAWLYFAVCGSHLALGRTLGKLTMRLQLGDVAGPDLPFGRSALRAALLLAGCVFWIGFGQYAAHLERTGNGLTPLPQYLQQLGWGINWGWLVGNMVFAAFEPFGRTLYDRVTGALVTTADSETESLQEFIATARTSTASPPRKSWMGLLVVPGLLITLFTVYYIVGKKTMAEIPEEIFASVRRQRDALFLPNFNRPKMGGDIDQPAGSDAKTTNAETMAVAITYEHVGPVDAEALKQDAHIMGTVDRILEFTNTEPGMQGWITDTFNRVNKQRREAGDATTTVPKQMRLEVAFAEKADLFFASDIVPKTSISKTVDLELGDPGSSFPLRIKTATVDKRTTGS